MISLEYVFLEKAEENLEAARSEFANRRYNSCASCCYYACFQAAVYALATAGIRPRGASERWGHNFVQAEFNGQLINRRKLYPAGLRTTLIQNYVLRETADYTANHVSEVRAARAVARAQQFLGSVTSGGGAQT